MPKAEDDYALDQRHLGHAQSGDFAEAPKGSLKVIKRASSFLDPISREPS